MIELMSKMSLPFLQQFGLTETESELYELMLELGEVPVWKIAQETKLKRPTIPNFGHLVSQIS